MVNSISLTDLRKIQYQQQILFTLAIDANKNNDFCCIQITRCLPGKRLSCQGTWNNKPVFAKFFIAPKRAKKHWQREYNGTQLLSNNNILSPSLVHSGTACNGDVHFLFFEYISNSQPLQLLWEGSNLQTQNQIILNLLKTIAKHHAQGILQKDLHLNNFILSDNKIYSLDGADIISFDKTNKTEAIKNLAQLFAQLPPWYDRYIESAFNAYKQYLPIDTDKLKSSDLLALTQQQREKRKQDFIAKTKRECSLFCTKTSWSQLIIYSRSYTSDTLSKILASPDIFIKSGKIVKRGNSSTVSIVTLDDKKWIIKRYNIKNWKHFLSRAFRPTRASKSWHNANLLTFYNIPTPAPIAFIENRFGPIRKTAYFISECSSGKTYWDALYLEPPSVAEKESIAETVTKLLQSLVPLKISHGDFKITNIMIEKGMASFIDLDSMQQHTSINAFKKARKKDIDRFLKNWENDPINGQFFNDLDLNSMD